MEMLLCRMWEIILISAFVQPVFQRCLTPYFWEILHTAPAFEISPTGDLNKAALKELQDEDG